MNAIILPIHSVLRWAIIVLLIAFLSRFIYGWLKKESWSNSDQKLVLILTVILDIQLLFGFLLVMNRSSGMWSRFIAEHVIPMIFAVGLAHIGKVMVSKAKESIAKYRRATIFFVLSFIIILGSIPW